MFNVYCHDHSVRIRKYSKTPADKVIAFDVNLADAIHSIKMQIEALECIDIDQQRLFYSGIHLNGDQTLSECNIKTESMLHVRCVIQP
ncbi:MAG: ubiquitin-like domain-containing protein, partial [Candidatus Fonsibacter sp.]